jgi:hypothetical protein
MKIKLRELNGTYYMRIGKEVKKMMGIDDEVEISIKDNKIIVEKVNEEIENK